MSAPQGSVPITSCPHCGGAVQATVNWDQWWRFTDGHWIYYGETIVVVRYYCENDHVIPPTDALTLPNFP